LIRGLAGSRLLWDYADLFRPQVLTALHGLVQPRIFGCETLHESYTRKMSCIFLEGLPLLRFWKGVAVAPPVALLSLRGGTGLLGTDCPADCPAANRGTIMA